VSFSSIETHEGTLVLHSIRDVTEFNRKQRRRAARHAVRQILLEAETLEIAAPQVLHAMGEILGWDGAIWWDVNPRTHELRRLASWCVPEFESTSFEMNLSMCSQAAASLPRGNGGIVWGSFSNEGSVQVRFGSESEPGESLTLPLAVGNEVLGRIELYREKCELPDENIGETMGVIGAQISQFLQRKRAEETLRRSEARKAAILEAALDGIVSVTRDGRVIELNSAADRMFGYPVGGAVGLRLADLILPPITTTPQSSGWTHVLSTGEKGMLGRRLELNGRRADGSTFPVEVAIAPIRAEGAAMFTAYIRDLTERKKTEEALRRAEEQFRQAQKMEAIGRLAGGVAHDFNNVLTVIIGFGEQLLMTMSKDHPERPAIEEIVKSGTRGADLTRQLLAFSRRQVLQPRLLDINGIVTDMEKMLNRLLGRQFPLTANLASDLPPVKADPCQIEQVLMNLVVNGRDAMPKGGTVFIETAAREVVDPCGHAHAEVAPGKYVTLSVRDTGCGMDEATKARIFEPFFTTKEKGKGTGLGLATVYGIVKQSGGGIVVESQPGQGSTFTIYLPQESKSSSDTRSAMPTINKAKDLRRLNEGTSSVKNRATPLTAG
jgi:PAS domain S-box-containing protein